MKYLLATTNKAKIKYFKPKLESMGIDVITLNDLKIDIDIDENGKNPVLNAVIKATTYNELSNMPTIALDDGLYLEGLPDELQPGTHVRRVSGKRLNDQEMIDYYISLVNKYGTNGKLKGYFLKGIAIVYNNETYTFEYQANREFSNKWSSVINEGYPLASIQIIEPFGKFKSELTKEEEKVTKDVEHKDVFEFILNTIKKLENKKILVKDCK